MPNNHSFVNNTNALLEKLDTGPSVNTAIDLANEILSLLGDGNKKTAEEAFEASLELPNAERYDSWFQPHPIFKSDRACFDLSDSDLFQAKFYWLKKHSRQIIAGGVHFTANFEDEDFTHNERYKVGIDFFLSPSGKSLQVVLSNRGNLRIVELNKRLNSTQLDIFTKWIDAGKLNTQEALHTTLWESFRLKSVNQKFYDGVSNSFNELLQHLKSIDKDDEEAKLFASRLLGRLLFCWFLRKKGIIDESIGYFNAKDMHATDYYRANLERLFFLTLNTPVDERNELQKQHQRQLFPDLLEEKQSSLFRMDQKTPYLNGGLFEPHANDWFNDKSLTLPEGYFTNLFSHFDEFNFTTDESSPEYEQVAIDPEMLGRVFESLLATQLDETGQQARKAKGAFYTPREIVSYMCKESLRHYLYDNVSDDEDVKSSIDNLLDISDSEWAKSKSNTLRDKVKNYRTQIIEALDIVTILDPACGSGAYPMGMLQLCTTTYERLESRFDPYKTKLQIIQNNIFGVDIEPMAVEIARLRVWLSLIVDEEDGRGVEPLPNLDFKFVCANSLVPLNQEIGLFSDTNLHQKLKDIRTKYFNARKPHTKKSLQDEYYSLTKSEQTSLIVDDTRTAQLKSFDPFKNAHPSIFFDNDQMFGLDGGFDIVIGNPPYIQLQKIKPQADMLSELDYKTFARTGDIYCLFYERGFQLLKPKGILSFITSNKWMRAAYGEKLRSYFIHQINPLWLIDFGGHQVFESATVDTNILIAQKAPFENKVKTCVLSKDFRQENMSVYFRQHHAITTSLTAENAWVVLSAIEQSIKEKIESVGTPLKEWEVNIYRGILTGFNEAFIIDQDTKEKLVKKSPKSVDIIRPILRGRDIKKYRSKFGQQWIINTHNGNKDNGIPPIEVERDYPAIFDHLKKYEVQLNARQDKGRHWTNLRNCAYLEDLNKEKIVWIELTDHPNFYLDTDSYYINNTVFFMVGKRLPYVLSFLNSKLCEWYFTKIAATSGAGTRRWIKMYVDQIPVPANIDPSVEIKLSSAVMSVQQYKLEKQDTQEIEGMIERNIMALYAFNAEEIAYINSLSF